jgi:hypothetical protein
LITDRPDFTESAVVVPRGSLQVELGSTWERSEGVNSLGGPEMLGRWGALERLELRVGLPDYVSADGISGVTDATLGLKLALGSPLGWDLAFIGDVSLPTGDADYGTSGSEGNLILATGRELDRTWSLGTQLSGAWSSEPGDLDLGYTVVLGRALTDEVSAFAELAGTSLEKDTRAVVVHHGYAYLVSPLLQVDLHAAFGLSAAAPDVLFGLGLSTRFD